MVRRMEIKCPVCYTVYNENTRICRKCYFTQLTKVFCSEDEKVQWYNEVVKPFKIYYEYCTNLKEIKRSADDLIKQQKNIIDTLNARVHALEAQIQKGKNVENEKTNKENNKRKNKETNEKFIGRVIKVGNYAGKNIEWIIVKKVENTILLLDKGENKQCRMKLPFHYEKKHVEWNDSQIKYWLEQFYDQSFTAKEKTKIIDYGDGKVFLLDREEYNHILKICNKFEINNDWWLRSVDENGKEQVAIVQANGEISYTDPMNDKIGVRPAMWMKI